MIRRRRTGAGTEGQIAVFANRQDAGAQLAERLARFREEDPVVLALPRGGVPVAFEVASVLDAPLDLVIVRKIGAPDQPELAVAAVVDGEHPEMVVNEDIAGMLRLPEDYLETAKARQLAEIERRRRLYLGHGRRVAVAGRTAIVIDDGIATGATVRAALAGVRRQAPRRLVLAVPVGPRDTLEALRTEADDVVCLVPELPWGAIGASYRDFRQLSDREVVDYLDRAAARREA